MRWRRSRRSIFHCRRSNCHLKRPAQISGGTAKRYRTQLVLPSPVFCPPFVLKGIVLLVLLGSASGLVEKSLRGEVKEGALWGAAASLRAVNVEIRLGNAAE
jgi:hypothetical protein